MRDIPLVFLQNSSCTSSTDPVEGVTMKERAKMIHAHSIACVPRITLNIGGSVGDENYTMCGPSFTPNFYFMWPGARIVHLDFVQSSLGPSTADSSSKPPPARRKPVASSAFDFPAGSAAWAAGRLLCDGIVEPELTRSHLARAVQISMLNHRPAADSRGQTRSVIRM